MKEKRQRPTELIMVSGCIRGSLETGPAKLLGRKWKPRAKEAAGGEGGGEVRQRHLFVSHSPRD